ncbi:methyltransferase domain-containing protein [Pseudovirgaria hyperparasitica]|uniref:tRNA N(3)-methylcytidine methyltransferase n=1 Tax=Pseudovirgaria hyperparasitica TaxID=470096 RepID=A0A6A6VQE4_9PEZI|nr:methyltransferase domain-containing protein [Pseudovirgaria hyperparasitica]KAF2752832.1 methyltransferase domain-containing protein [Pseudovirgaria hyperparasitica]
MSSLKGPSRTPKSQLSASMEHIRYAVTADPLPHQPFTSSSSKPDPNQKRTDPFQFGTRVLLPSDDPFAYNAWDHAVPDAEYALFALAQYEFQRSAPVTPFDKMRFNAQPERFWNAFYGNNTSNFFKDRKWLAQEFPVLNAITSEGAESAALLEVGAGVGNTAFPVLALNRNPRLRIHAVDFSVKAVELMRANENYVEPMIRADVWDATSDMLPPGVCEGSIDVVIMVFVFSALAPKQWEACVRNIWRVLKPGGCVLFRDYGRGDLAQVRFKKGRYLEENFYIRGDGTRVYFFEREELRNIWLGRMFKNGNDEKEVHVDNREELDERDTGIEESLDTLSVSMRAVMSEPSPAFEVVKLGVDRRMLVNRQRKIKMYRCWMQAVFKKPGPTSLLDQLSTDAISRQNIGDIMPPEAMDEVTVRAIP